MLRILRTGVCLMLLMLLTLTMMAAPPSAVRSEALPKHSFSLNNSDKQPGGPPSKQVRALEAAAVVQRSHATCRQHVN